MFDRRTLLTAALGAVLVLPRGAAAGDLLEEMDKDHSGSLDLDAVTKAAGTVFAKLDRDHGGTLDRKEIGKEKKLQTANIIFGCRHTDK